MEVEFAVFIDFSLDQPREPGRQIVTGAQQLAHTPSAAGRRLAMRQAVQ